MRPITVNHTTLLAANYFGFMADAEALMIRWIAELKQLAVRDGIDVTFSSSAQKPVVFTETGESIASAWDYAPEGDWFDKASHEALTTIN